MTTHRIFAAIYDRMNAPLERHVLGARRERLLAGLIGDVLDVGAGTGVNLPYFEKATRVVAVEPSAPMRARLQRKAQQVTVPVEVCDATAESLPFADCSFDAVVFTLALCTIPDPAAALAEARRLLKLGGELVVLEHVRGRGKLARRQDRWERVWSHFGAGCHPNRDTRAAIERAGFTFDEVEQFAELPRWVLTRTMLQGTATRKAHRTGITGVT
jgi:ubiquinone/menaquinone biosynthesis C-methylase UbiE